MKPEKSSEYDITNPVHTINNTVDSNLHVSDFYNISVQSKGNPHTFETKHVKILDFHSNNDDGIEQGNSNVSGTCLLYTSPSPRDQRGSRMPSSA